MAKKIELSKKELPKRRLVQYVFLDVVEFTRRDRSDEDMTRIILTLNEVVQHALSRAGLRQQNRIVLPTGDGMCIAILNSKVHDTPLQLAMDIRRSVDGYNALFLDETERFQLRISVHQNHDFILPDFNGNRNVFGQGINTAARLNCACDPSHIAVSQVVYETTCRDSKYMKLYDTPREVLIKGQTFSYFSLRPGLGEGLSLIEMIGRYKSRVGSKLTLDDIRRLDVGDQVFHAVYGLGTIRTIAVPGQTESGRQVNIDFREREYSVRLTNVKGDYHKWS